MPVCWPQVVAKQRLTAKAFGEWIAEKRGERSHRALARPIRDLLRPTGVKAPASAIVKVEQGRVPNVPLLFGLSLVLKVPYEEMTYRLLTDLGMDLTQQRSEMHWRPKNQDAEDNADVLIHNLVVPEFTDDDRRMLELWKRLPSRTREKLREFLEVLQAA